VVYTLLHIGLREKPAPGFPWSTFFVRKPGGNVPSGNAGSPCAVSKAESIVGHADVQESVQRFAVGHISATSQMMRMGIKSLVR